MSNTITRTAILTLWLAVGLCRAQELPKLRLALAPTAAAAGVAAGAAEQLTAALTEAFAAQAAFALVDAAELQRALESAPADWSRKDRMRSAANRARADTVLVTGVLAVSRDGGGVELHVEGGLVDVVTGTEVGYYRNGGAGRGGTEDQQLAAAAKEAANQMAAHFTKGSRLVGRVRLMSVASRMVVILREPDASVQRGMWVYAFRDGKRLGGIELTSVTPKQLEGKVRYLAGAVTLVPGDLVVHAFTPRPLEARTPRSQRRFANVLKGVLAVGLLAAILNRDHGPGPTGSIAVDSTPRGADILLDGAATGQRTPFTLTVPVGAHVLTLRRTGYLDATLNVTVAAGQVANATAILRPGLPPPSPAPGP